MGHLVRLLVSGFSKPDPQTHTQPQQQSCCGTTAVRHASYKERQYRRYIERSAKKGGSGGSDTSPSAMHDSPGNRTGPPTQEGMRGLVPGRWGHGFRIHTTRHPRHELIDAPAVVHLLLCMGAGNVPSVRNKGALEVHRNTVPRSSTPVRYRTRGPQPAFPRHTTPCSRTPISSTQCTPEGSIGHGEPGAGACLRLQQIRPTDPLLA